MDSTCKETGSYDEVVYCSTCGDELSRAEKVIDKKSHTEVVDKAVAATCTETGLTEGKHCSVCKEVLVAQKAIPANGHSYNNGVITTESTCTEKGVKTFTCAICGDTYTEEVGATGHIFDQKNIDTKYLKSAATPTESAVYYYSCTCGEKGAITFTHGDVLPGYLTYQLSPNSAYYIVTGFVGNDENIAIPYIYDSLPVLGIMASAFKDNTTVKSIDIPNSIKEIGSYAFAGCTSLESVAVPTSVKNISEYTFSGCTAMKAITLHSGIEVIGVFAFENCTALKSVTLSEGLLTISDNAFVNCSSLEGITIPDTVTTLGNMAFKNATSLKYVNFSKALESIGNATFNNCINLESVELHEDISTLGSSAFSGCKGLKTLRILGDLESIGSFIFYDCSGLTSIYYASRTKGNISDANYIFYNAGIDADGITLTLAKDAVVPDGLFTPCGEDNMPKIVKIIIEDGTTEVRFSMTYNKLPYLTEIVYPSTVTDPCYGAFNNSLWWDNQQIGKVFINGVLYGYKCKNCKIAVPSVVVQENRIEPTLCVDGHFDSVIYCEKCDEELSRDTITILASHGTRIEVQENKVEPTTCIDGYFDSVIYCEICNEEFSRIKKVIPAPHIVEENFCTLCGQEYFSSGLEFTSNGDNTCYVSGIGECIDTNIKIPRVSPNGDLVTGIGYRAFASCISLTSIIIPNSITSIGAYVFVGCTSLTSIIIPNSITSIGNYAFYNCSSLVYNEYSNAYYLGSESNPYFILITAKTTSIRNCEISSSTKFICSEAFYYCKSLTNITIPSSVSSIGKNAFLMCGLTSITVSKDNTKYKSVDGNLYSKDGKTLIQYAIEKETTSFVIPDSVITIGCGAFAGCYNLTKITIPTSVTVIESAAFGSCYLKSLNYCGTKEQWEAITKHDSWEYRPYIGGTFHYTIIYNSKVQ